MVCPSYEHGSFIQIYILPPESQQLTLPGAGQDRGREQREVFGRARREEPQHLVLTKKGHLLSGQSWFLSMVRGVIPQVAPDNGVFEYLMQNRDRLDDRAW